MTRTEAVFLERFQQLLMTADVAGRLQRLLSPKVRHSILAEFGYGHTATRLDFAQRLTKLIEGHLKLPEQMSGHFKLAVMDANCLGAPLQASVERLRPAYESALMKWVGQLGHQPGGLLREGALTAILPMLNSLPTGLSPKVDNSQRRLITKTSADAVIQRIVWKAVRPINPSAMLKSFERMWAKCDITLHAVHATHWTIARKHLAVTARRRRARQYGCAAHSGQIPSSPAPQSRRGSQRP